MEGAQCGRWLMWKMANVVGAHVEDDRGTGPSLEKTDCEQNHLAKMQQCIDKLKYIKINTT